jgi:hypothetical protein
MRTTAVIFSIALLASCTKHNPDSCCITDAQCASYGYDGITPCDAARVCNANGACVAPECTTSADCTAPDAPVCVNQLCVGACVVDDDCMGIPGRPFCAMDGSCVACTDDTQCSVDAPVCDPAGHACRGCANDSECTSGACLESQGSCAATSQLIFVRSGGSDSGGCDSSAPCLTLGFAFTKLTTQRNVIKILGGVFSVGGSAIDLSGRSAFIDGSNTLVTQSATGAVFSMSGTGGTPFTLSDMAIGLNGTNNRSVALTGGSLNTYNVHFLAQATVSAGTLRIDHSTVDGTSPVSCTANGSLSIRSSTLHVGLLAQGCTIEMLGNRFDAVNAVSLNATGSLVTVENNTIVNSDYYTDTMTVATALAGSAIRFNTFVNTSGVDQTATVLTCSAAVTATSNIFAWHSSAPPSCATRYSLFDSFAGQQPGTGNRTGDASTFFVDLQAKDFHLAPNSPARGMGEPGLPTVSDIDGMPRPQPSGSNPDMGAYEMP